jgi:hypothetical protein
MTAQMEHLAEMAAWPNVTVQVVPEQASAYAGLSGGFTAAAAADGQQAAHLDTGVQGMTVLEPTLVGKVMNMFDMLRAEALPRTPSLDLITEAITTWTERASSTGGHQATPAPTEVTALKSVRPTR